MADDIVNVQYQTFNIQLMVIQSIHEIANPPRILLIL